MKKDRYRRERRRLRADALLIARKVDRETRRKLWRLSRLMSGGFTSLSRVVYLDEDLRGRFLRFHVFPGWDKTPGVTAWGRAVCRQARKAANRRAQRERMKAYQERAKRRYLPLANACTTCDGSSGTCTACGGTGTVLSPNPALVGPR